MKKILILLVAPLIISSPTVDVNYEELTIDLPAKNIKPVIEEEDLVSAIILVESRGNDSAIGDRHLVGNEAIGALQIRPIMVREVNRILKLKKAKKHYQLKDRFNREKSIEMFLIWKEFHHKDSDYETIARNWNGGPNGYKKSRTEKYWQKVQNELDGI